MRTYLVCAVALAVVCAAPAVVDAAESPALARSRALYNAGDYEGAIDAAAVARRETQWADAAALVIARSHLERYRQNRNASELAEARDALQSVRSASLSPRDQVDLLIGLGQALFLAEIYGPAADLFDTALERAMLGPKDRVNLLDWWATALDFEAQKLSYDRRAPVYQRIADRMSRELRDDPASGVANYWQVVAARGVGDLDRAWSAAIAAWVRSTLDPAATMQLRADLDRVMEQALIPERARSVPIRDGLEPVETLRAEWALVKQNWK
jgi:hypothetical protein